MSDQGSGGERRGRGGRRSVKVRNQMSDKGRKGRGGGRGADQLKSEIKCQIREVEEKGGERGGGKGQISKSPK